MEALQNTVARRRRGRQSGFTLIELLVVIAVLAILAAIVIFNVVGVTKNGTNASACTDQKSVQTAIDAALNDGNYTGSSTSSVTPATGVVWASLVPQYIHTGPAGSGVTGAPAKYGNLTPTWSQIGDGHGGWTVTNGINGC